MKIITCYNELLYEKSGVQLIKSASKAGLKIIRYSEDCGCDYSLLNDIYHQVKADYIDKPLDFVFENQLQRRWFGFFLKILSLHHAIHMWDNEMIMFVDCDCRFKKQISEVDILQHLKDTSEVGYFRGNRKNIESSVLVFRNTELSKKIIKSIVSEYTTGNIFKHKAIDDGSILVRFLDSTWQDFAEGIQKDSGHHIIPYTWLSHFIVHDKGKHYELYVKHGDTIDNDR